jgi:hypothetical protein
MTGVAKKPAPKKAEIAPKLLVAQPLKFSKIVVTAARRGGRATLKPPLM